jgi:hypothetical protein
MLKNKNNFEIMTSFFVRPRKFSDHPRKYSILQKQSMFT